MRKNSKTGLWIETSLTGEIGIQPTKIGTGLSMETSPGRGFGIGFGIIPPEAKCQPDGNIR